MPTFTILFKKIKTLTSHFHHFISNHSHDKVTEDIINQQNETKAVRQRTKLEDLLKFVLSQEKRLTILSHIIPIVAILQTSTASCEREFSKMNFIENKFRSVSHLNSLNDLLSTTMCE
jgi:hypothetical protein